MKLCVLKNFIRKPIEIIPKINAEIEPTRSCGQTVENNSLSPTISKSLYNPDPPIIGIESKNENLIAKSFLSPRKYPPEIVIPARDIPGKSARD